MVSLDHYPTEVVMGVLAVGGAGEDLGRTDGDTQRLVVTPEKNVASGQRPELVTTQRLMVIVFAVFISVSFIPYHDKDDLGDPRQTRDKDQGDIKRKRFIHPYILYKYIMVQRVRQWVTHPKTLRPGHDDKHMNPNITHFRGVGDDEGNALPIPQETPHHQITQVIPKQHKR